MSYYLELLSSIGIESSIIVEDIDKLQFVSHANFIIVRIMRWCNLHSTSPKCHINHNRISDYRKAPINKRMDRELPMEMLWAG